MPGIVGCIAPQGRIPAFAGDCAKLLAHEPSYQITTLPSNSHSVLLLVDPGIHPLACGFSKDADSGTLLAYYGDFHNEELTDGDIAGKLLRLYQKHQAELPNILDGSFVVLAQDPHQTILFNDHCGSKPLFYTTQGETLYFSPELKALARQPSLNLVVDEDAAVMFLANGYLAGDQTWYRDVRPLRAGSVLQHRNGSTSVRSWYSYVPCGEGSADKGEEHYVEALSAVLRHAVRKQARRAPSSIVPISGGLDSRGILCCLREIHSGPLQTVSWGTDETTPGTDASMGAQLARHFGTTHHFVKRDSNNFAADIEPMIQRVDGLTTDPAAHHGELRAMQRIRYEFGASLLLRGDECFGYHGSVSSTLEALAAVCMRELSAYPVWRGLVRGDLLPSWEDRSRAIVADIARQCPFEDPTVCKDYFYETERLFHYLHRSTYYKTTVLDVANPWLDREVFDFYRDVPIRYRVDKYLYRKTLEKMFPAVMRIPMASSNGLESWPGILQRDPSLQQFIRHHLLERQNRFHEFMDMDRLRDFVNGAFVVGKDRPSGLDRLARLKDLVRTRMPGVYRLIKRQTLSHFRFAEINVDDVLFRMLVLKLWFDLDRRSRTG